MREELIKFIRDKNWHKKIAKTKPYTQSLFEHSLVVYDIIDSTIKLLNDTTEKFSDKEKNILRISAILHDIGKGKAEWQEAVKKGQKPPSHIDEDLAKAGISDLKKHIKIEDEQTILRCIGLHHKAAQSAGNIIKSIMSEAESSNWKELQDFVDSADNLASCGTVLDAIELLESKRNFRIRKLFKYTYHKIYLRGVSSIFLHKACQEAYKAKGWEPILYFPEGTCYLSITESKGIEKEEISNKLKQIIHENIKENAKSLVVPKIIMDNKAIPMPELFDYDELPFYLKKVRGRKNPTDFQKYLNSYSKPESYETLLENEICKKTIKSYSYQYFWKTHSDTVSKNKIKETFKNELEDITNSLLSDKTSCLETLKSYSEDIISAQDEVACFKFYQASIKKDIWGLDITEKIKENYEKIFGQRALSKLKAMSNNDYSNEMAYSIYPFWELNTSDIIDYIGDDELIKTISNFTKVAQLKPKIRKEVLCEILHYIWEKVEIEEENKPKRKIASKMANDFLLDIQYPITDNENYKLQLENYGKSKINSKKASGDHVCPICNSAFNKGKLSTVDIVDNPEGFTNRAEAHGKPGKVVICEKCRSEIYLKKILLNESSFNKTIFLVPHYNFSNQIGVEFLKVIDDLRQKTENLMSEFSTNPELIPDFSKTTKIASNVLKNIDDIESKTIEDFILADNKPKDFEEESIRVLLEYNPDLPLKKDESKALDIINDKFRKAYKKFAEFTAEIKKDDQFREMLSIKKKNIKRDEIDKALIGYFGDDFPIKPNLEKSLEMLNNDFVTKYDKWAAFIDDVKRNKIESEIAKDIVRKIYKLIPKYRIIAQTPNFVIIPLKQSLRWSDDSDINGCIRELFISIIFALKLNCSIAIADNILKIDIEQRKGSVFVPENSLLQQLVGDSWLRDYDFNNEKGINIKSDVKWLKAIASVLCLSYRTTYSERTNLYEILKSKTKGHLLRRIEMKDEQQVNNSYVYDYIENIWGVKK